MDKREKRAEEAKIKSLEDIKREYESMHPEDTYKIQAMQNEINGRKAYIRGWS